MELKILIQLEVIKKMKKDKKPIDEMKRVKIIEKRGNKDNKWKKVKGIIWGSKAKRHAKGL